MARRILVVEDEAPIREMVCFVLEQNGFQPVEAEDYDSAVNQLNEPWPDLILLDWMLPGGSGIQFIKHLKRESMTRDIPEGKKKIACAALKPVRMTISPSRFLRRSWWRESKR